MLTDAVTDFSAVAAAHAPPPLPPDNAAIVADVPAPPADRGVLPPPPSSADAVAAAPADAGVWAAAVRAVTAIAAREPPREPQTYLNALSAGAIHSEPTESERQRDVTLSLPRRAAAAWETARLSAILWWLDVLVGVSTWMGWFAPHDGSHHEHKEPG